jgi:hypothetical protein
MHEQITKLLVSVVAALFLMAIAAMRSLQEPKGKNGNVKSRDRRW